MQARSFGIEQVQRIGFACSHPGAPIRSAASDMLATVVTLRLPDGPVIVRTLLADTPGNRGMSLTTCMEEASRWVAQRTPIGASANRADHAIVQIDRQGCVDAWSSAGFAPLSSAGAEPRSVDALIGSVAGGLALWIEHVTTVDLLDPPAHSDLLRPLEEFDLGRPSLPMLGMGATIVHGTTFYPATVYRVPEGPVGPGTGVCVGVRRDLIQHQGRVAGTRIASPIPHPWAPLERFELDPDGRWRSVMAPRLLLHIGARNASPGI